METHQIKKTNIGPFFSIVIPTLDEEIELPKLLKDIDDQDYDSYETHIVDCGSKDNTQQIVKDHPTAKLIVSPKAHVSSQRNLGAQNAKGQYLLFFDADTRIPNYFLTGIRYRISVHTPDGFTAWTSQDGDATQDRVITTAINAMLESNRVLEAPIISLGAFIGCKASTFKKINGFDESITFAEDKKFIATLINNNYKYQVFRDPKYTFSLRRFRKEGTLPSLRKLATMYSAYVLNGSRWPTTFQKNYPMLGGSFYKQNRHHTSLFDNLYHSITAIRKLRKRRNIGKLFEKIFRGDN